MSEALKTSSGAAALSRFVWGDDPRPGWQKLAARILQIGWAVGRDITAGMITLRAMSLVYTTLLSLVPLLAISFSILKGFGVHNQVEPFLFNALEPLGERREEIVERIVGFVDNVQVGVLGSVGFLLLFYTVVSLMQKIELAFNDVWQISGKRSFSERFKDYLSVIIVGPVLVFSSLGITATVMSDPMVESVTSIAPLGWLVELAGRLVPIVMIVVAFTFIYIFVPNTRVRLVPALTGGLVAGLLWNGLGWAFAGFVAQASNYTAIYSGFATPILFMIWLYMGWLILLVGATIAFYRQHPEYLSGRQQTGHLSGADRERLTLNAVCLIGRRFYAGNPPPDSDLIGQQLGVAARIVAEVLEPLTEQGLLATTGSTLPAYLPGSPWERTSVYEVLEAAHRARPTASVKRPLLRPVTMNDASTVDAVVELHAKIARDAFDSVSLKQLATGEWPPIPLDAANRETSVPAPS